MSHKRHPSLPERRCNGLKSQGTYLTPGGLLEHPTPAPVDLVGAELSCYLMALRTEIHASELMKLEDG